MSNDASAASETLDAHPGLLLTDDVPVYSTPLGGAYEGDARRLLAALPSNSIDLVVTSPPYALEFQKEYGNAKKADYVAWLRPFAEQIHRVLSPTGSLVLNMGGSYNPGSPTRSLYHYKVVLMLVEQAGFHLAHECFWHNPAKRPSPAEWVNVRRQRIKDAVEYVWWFGKTEWPKADNRSVLVEYSKDMRRLIERGYRAKVRPSGHVITPKFQRDHGGSIPSNLIERGNNESNSAYMRACAAAGVKPHPARYPASLPDFFIRFLTDTNDLVLDPFAGSNTTGAVAEGLQRRWLSFELNGAYVAASRFRFPSIGAEAAS
jgi:site-specific DNA-methyltransferase (cytosine-N4-specific)